MRRISDEAHDRLIEAMTKLSTGALQMLAFIPSCNTLQTARDEAGVAKQYVREAHAALLEVNRELCAQHRDGCCCLLCRNKVM